MEDNYASQSMFSQMPLKNELVGFSEEEGLVGQFSSRMFRNSEAYLVSHLNNLLHGILTATKTLLECRKSKLCNNNLDKLVKNNINLD